MVHKLRNRDICQSSPRSNQMQSRLAKTFMGNIGHSTPKHNEILRQRNVLSKRSVLVNMSNVGQDSTIRLNQREGGRSDNICATFNNLNNSKSQIKLHNIIDGYIFSHTFGKKSGVSLYAVKKSLREEQPYNSYRTSKQVSRYIAFSIKTGKFQQITGQGAAGTFRLNRSIHNGHLETLRRLRKVSLQSHTILRQKSNRQAKHNTVL
ncbi:uncharacterized protein LOC126751386 [Bactrocera neohumeralis]|uniref:uncharacterized protein LOC120766580 n=1 Tax=Bactrocera tryoni TaxID=59916 RepID=UPI001A965407|nr:uncharacterized protein LOC120766580 [Bactrocera tryoni]XP_050317564.1 uncharacterized protein LOC126751386 [Bactrocera neohumeralis]